MKHRNVPEIRFREWSEPWYKSKVKEVYKFQYGCFNINPSNGGQYPVYGANGVIGSYTEYNAEDSIIIGHMGEYAGSVIWGKGKHFVTYNGTISTPNISQINPMFGFYLLTQLNISNICGGSGQPFLSYDALNRIDSKYPESLTEQTQIGSYFKELDRMIGLHQRKHDKLLTLKQAMLQKMFPKPGTTTPEIRFKGFSEPWVEKKLGDLCKETHGGGTPKTSVSKFWHGEIPWIQSSDLKNDCLYSICPRKWINDLSIKKSATKLIPKNSIAIVTRVGVGKLALIEFSYATSQDFVSLSKLDIDPLFAVIALSILLQSKLHETQGTSIKGMTKEELLSFTFTITKDESEQQKIGTYFRNLDDLISKHSTQLTKLKNIKAACLEKMFV